MLKPNTMKVLIILASVLAFALSVPTPKFIHPCKIKAQDFHECALKEAIAAVPHMVKGVRSLKIPPLDPLHLPEVNINSPNLNIKFTEVTVNGLRNSVVRDLKLTKETGEMEIFVDNIVILSHYNMNGRILILPILGEGKSNITAVDGVYTYKSKFEPYKRDGKTYARVKDSSVTFDLKRTYFHFDNLFNGDPKLGAEMNKFLNDNWSDVTKELGGAISETISAVVTSIITNFFEGISQEELYGE